MKATVKVDAERVVGRVDPLIFGHFIEHLGRCIYGGVLDERGNYRLELIEAMRRIRPSILRWPGGCFADGYHWRDGVGPRDRRPIRMNLAWHNADESNGFGTDEHVGYCSVGDSARVFELTGSGPAARNTVQEPEAVCVKTRPPARSGSSFVHTFAPRSATVLEIPLAGSKGPA